VLLIRLWLRGASPLGPLEDSIGPFITAKKDAGHPVLIVR